MKTEPPIFGQSASYERFMGRWSRQLAPLLVRFAGIREDDVVLDVGSGTGSLSSAIAEASPSAHIVGVEPASPFVSYAKQRESTGRIRFLVGDSQCLPLHDRLFDRVLSLLVINFIPDRAKALEEMIRVCRPGGVIAAAVWDYGEGMEMLRIFWDGAIAGDPAIAARDERHLPLCRSGELAALWRSHGLTRVEEQSLTTELSFASFEDYWSPFLGGQAPAGTYVAGLLDPERASLGERLRKRILDDRPDRAFSLRARAWAVKGTV